jgi:RNA polymerase sigma-70 factor, ECF subfamily
MAQLHQSTDGELATLVRRARSPEPDGAAERALCQLFAPRIRLFGLKHLRDGHAADDLVQEVLVTLIRSLRAGDGPEPDRVVSFVLGTCRQLVRAGARVERRRNELLERYVHDLIPQPDAERHALDRDHLGRCITRLPPREYQVLYETFYGNRSPDEMSRALGLTQVNIRVVRHRAIARLRACLEGDAP